jgi:hypothetical protein
LLHIILFTLLFIAGQYAPFKARSGPHSLAARARELGLEETAMLLLRSIDEVVVIPITMMSALY